MYKNVSSFVSIFSKVLVVSAIVVFVITLLLSGAYAMFNSFKWAVVTVIFVVSAGFYILADLVGE